MSKSLFAAWIVGEIIIIYRVVSQQKRPPFPGELLASSGLFVMLAALSGPAPSMANVMGWGFDIAAFLNLAPSILKKSANVPAGAGGPLAGASTKSAAKQGTGSLT